MLIRLLLISLLIFLSYSIEGQDCVIDNYKKEYKIIKNLILAHSPAKALVKSDSILKIIESKGLTGCKTSLLIQIEKSEALELLGKYEDALEFYYSILQIAKQKDYWEIMAEIYISIGRVLETIGRGKDCKRNLEKARQIIAKHKINVSYSRYAIRYSSYHRIYDDHDSARHYAKQGIIFGKQYNIVRSQIDGNLLLGILNYSTQDAIPYFIKARDLYLNNNSYYGAASQSLNIAEVYFKQKEYKKVTNHLNDALRYEQNQVDAKGSYYIKYRVYDIKKSIFKLNNQLDSAFFYSELSHVNHSKSINLIDQEKINEIEILKAVEDDQKEIKLLQRQKSIYIWSSFIGLAIIILFVFLMVRIYRKDKKIRRQHEELGVKNIELNNSLDKQSTLLSEIHHRVKNNLQLVISILVLQGEKAMSKSSKSQLLDISNKVRSIALIHDQLYQEGEFDTINIKNYFEKLFLHFKNLVKQENFNFQININNVYLNLETLLPIGIICSELICNSIKYAIPSNGQLVLKLEILQKQDEYYFSFVDNGNGSAPQEHQTSKTGMGTLLIKSLVRQLRAEVNNNENDRTIFNLKFKEKNVSPI